MDEQHCKNIYYEDVQYKLSKKMGRRRRSRACSGGTGLVNRHVPQMLRKRSKQQDELFYIRWEGTPVLRNQKYKRKSLEKMTYFVDSDCFSHSTGTSSHPEAPSDLFSGQSLLPKTVGQAPVLGMEHKSSASYCVHGPPWLANTKQRQNILSTGWNPHLLSLQQTSP